MIQEISPIYGQTPLVRRVAALEKEAAVTWYFGRDAHGSFITNGAFLAYMTAAEQAAIMLHWKLVPALGSWDPWDECDASVSRPVPDVAALVAGYTPDDPVAEDTHIEYRDPDHSLQYHWYRVGDTMIPIDTAYCGLLADSPVRMHGPAEKAALWTAGADGTVAVSVMRLRASAPLWDQIRPMLIALAESAATAAKEED